MQMVILTALGVGGATVFGSIIGFLFKKISHRFSRRCHAVGCHPGSDPACH